MSVYVTIDVLYKNYYMLAVNGNTDAWITIYQEKVLRPRTLKAASARFPWLFSKLAAYSDILLQLSDIVNGIEKNEQLALLYVNHEVDVIRQMAMAIVKYGPRGVNITYKVVSGSGMLA